MGGGVLLVRHGATPHNNPDDERLRGWLDVPLAAPGVIAARQAAKAIAPFHPTRMYTSDLTRALDTAKIMSVTLGLTPLRTRELRPWDLGQMAGQRIADVLPILQAYTNGKKHLAPPGSAESFAQFLERTRKILVTLLDLARRTQEEIVAVSHARVLYALEPILFGTAMPVQGPPEPGAVVRVSGPMGQVVLETVYPGRTLDGAMS